MPPASKYPGLLKRLKEALQVRNQAEVAKLLGVSEAEVASWNRRGDIPASVLLQVGRFSNASINWLLTGAGPKILRSPAAPELSSPASEPEETSEAGNACEANDASEDAASTTDNQPLPTE